MAASQTKAPSKRAGAVKELLTEARVDSLNTVLADLGIATDKIITILPVPAQNVGNPTPPQFRVLYRAG